MDSFSTMAKLGLKYYIYALICPITNKIFYIGKGHDDRVFEHALEVDSLEEGNQYKLDKIRELKKKGLTPKYVILKHGIEDEKLAYDYEATLIDMFTNPESPMYGMTELTNDVSGHHTEINGVKTVEQIQSQYDCPQLVCAPGDKLMCVHVNNYATKENMWENAKGLWKMSPESLQKAHEATYVLAEYLGVIIGAFNNLEWHEALDEKDHIRYYFIGDFVDDCPYLYTAIPKRERGHQWPVIFYGYNS